MTVVTENADETRAVAGRLASLLQAGDLVLLHGDLGSGKTTFTQGLAEGLSIAEAVTSPTFTLVQEYQGGRLPLYHFDLYRLDGPEDAFGLGFFDYLDYGGVVVVEWPERLENDAPMPRLDVTLTEGGESRRTITFVPVGERFARLLGEWPR